MILYSFLLHPDVELTTDKLVKRLNCKFVCFLFKFVWLKSLVTKQTLRTKCVTSILKLCNIILLSILKSMFYSFQRQDSCSKKHVKEHVHLSERNWKIFQKSCFLEYSHSLLPEEVVHKRSVKMLFGKLVAMLQEAPVADSNVS